MSSEAAVLFLLVAILTATGLADLYSRLSAVEATAFLSAALGLGVLAAAYGYANFSKAGRERKRRIDVVKQIPVQLRIPSDLAVRMGVDTELEMPVYLPDSVRSRHVHILGATGSGKTESVILNFLKQDVARGLGSVILDAKGDTSFLWSLKEWVPSERLRIFDLSSPSSLPYDPLAAGSALESAERLFSSLTWSEEYYRSKAKAALQRLFGAHRSRHDRNPSLTELSECLEDADTFAAIATSRRYSKKVADKDFLELSGLRDQVRTLCSGHLAQVLSPKGEATVQLAEAESGCVIYFRLQSLLSPQLVSTVGKLVINHLNYLAGTAHRAQQPRQSTRKIIPVYLDEFASFACPEFADLISKARSAGYALHFSHQSIGDLAEVAEGFLNRITDNSATKIVLRINDPDSAEYLARTFGTRLYQKITQRITNAQELDLAEVVGEGTQREAHQFRASPDLFKTLPTGMGSVLVAHGLPTPHGASTVFKIQFPKL